jgi:hypothetical protein
MGPGVVYCLDCRRAVPLDPTSHTHVSNVPVHCPWCPQRPGEPRRRMKFGFDKPAGAYEPTEDDKETFRCAGMAWSD